MNKVEYDRRIRKNQVGDKSPSSRTIHMPSGLENKKNRSEPCLVLHIDIFVQQDYVKCRYFYLQCI